MTLPFGEGKLLKSMRIRNFKAWKDTGRIRLAPITVFFGPNSSGKTSIHQLLLMLKQTAASPDRKRVLHLGDSRTLVDLGTFADILHAHDPDERMSFDLEWKRTSDLDLHDPLAGATFRGDSLTFEAELAESANQALLCRRTRYTLGNPEESGLEIGMVLAEGEKMKYELKAKGFQPVRRQGRPWDLPAPVRFYGFPDEAIAYFQNTGLLADLTLEMEQLLERIRYVGPLREYPQRLYPWSGEVPEHVGVTGGRAVEALLAARGRQLNRGPRTHYRYFEEIVAGWLERMRMISSFRVQMLAEGRKEYEVLIRTAPRSAEVRLTDVGFGVSQVLPVIVECFYVPHDSIVVFEQPEIHLHPRVQADLADLFIEAVLSREDGIDRNIQLVVESHSEHLLRRLQRRVAEGAIKPDDVALFFCEFGFEHSSISELQIDLFGNVVNWPQNFFGDEMGDLIAMAQAAAARESRRED